MAQAFPTQKQFFKLAIPNILTGLCVPITLMVDIAYLGHLDNFIDLSGVILATIIFDYLLWSFGFLRVGTTGLTAQAHGKQDIDEQSALFWRPVILGFVIGALITIFQSPIGDISFAMLSGEANVETAGREYFNSHIWGAIPIMISFAIIGWLLGQGKSGIVLISHLIWQISNIVLNYFFIVKFGWGAWGAGLGTALAEWIALIFEIFAVLIYWKGLPKFNKKHILRWHKLKELTTLNGAIMVRTLLITTVLAAFTNISATFSTVELASNALMMKLFMFFAYIADGFAVTLETLSGRSIGKNNRNELNRSFNLAIGWTYLTTLIFVITYIFGAEHILLLLTDHQNIIDNALIQIYWLCAIITFGGAAFVYDGFFYGLAKPKILLLSMAAAALTFTPIAYYAWIKSSTETLWAAFLAFMIMRVITLFNPARKALK